MSFTGDDYVYSEMYLDSGDCTEVGGIGYTANNWPLFVFGEQYSDIVGIKLLEAQIPYTHYLPRIFFNLQEQPGGLSGGVTMDDRPYDVNDYGTFASDLQTKINAYGFAETYTVTFDSKTRQMNITGTQSIIGEYFEVWTTTNDDYYGFRNDSFNRVSSSVYSGGSACTLTSPYQMNVAGSPYYYINSNALASSSRTVVPSNRINNQDETNGPQIWRTVRTTAANGFYSQWYNRESGGWIFVDNQPLLGRIDFFITWGNAPQNIPVDLHGVPFNLKLGIMQYKRRDVKRIRDQERFPFQDGYDIFDDRRNKRFRGLVDECGEPIEPPPEEEEEMECFEEIIYDVDESGYPKKPERKPLTDQEKKWQEEEDAMVREELAKPIEEKAAPIQPAPYGPKYASATEGLVENEPRFQSGTQAVKNLKKPPQTEYEDDDEDMNMFDELKIAGLSDKEAKTKIFYHKLAKTQKRMDENKLSQFEYDKIVENLFNTYMK